MIASPASSASLRITSVSLSWSMSLASAALSARRALLLIWRGRPLMLCHQGIGKKFMRPMCRDPGNAKAGRCFRRTSG